jgi:hypothetical protein
MKPFVLYSQKRIITNVNRQLESNSMNYKDNVERLIEETLEKKGIGRYKEYRQLIEDDLVTFVNEMETTYRKIDLRVFFETEFNSANDPYIKVILCNEDNSDEKYIHLISTFNKYVVGVDGGSRVNSNKEAIIELKKQVANISWIKTS